ncbi:hypothetical protein EV363DRAFT_215809 [Boletus edulis]|nr:hypothetical protein EV363DRAFT_215809 [Boletus edulis]
MSTTGTLPFTVNELCYHEPLIYEGKVMKTEMWDETNTKLAGVGPHFFVLETNVRLPLLVHFFFLSIRLCLLFCFLRGPLALVPHGSTRHRSQTDSRVLFHRWDEWVPVARLLKFNETNVALQKALSSQASQAASSSGAGSKKGAGGSGSGEMGGGTGTGTGRGGRKDGRGTKRGREESV